jgi:hypothetical protein
MSMWLWGQIVAAREPNNAAWPAPNKRGARPQLVRDFLSIGHTDFRVPLVDYSTGDLA